jgi:2-oxoglutarate dehydrogenase E2 component (dihydrolipoamide succinyltransferase)
MAQYELIMPKMGESITEATILKWNKKEGDTINIDDAVLEIATDKVDSEVPSPVAGVLQKILFNENDVVAVGKVVALIETSVGATTSVVSSTPAPELKKEVAVAAPQVQQQTAIAPVGDRFYSPLVLNIARQEGVALSELETMPGTGQGGRVTKKDILQYVENKKNGVAAPVAATMSVQEVQQIEAPKIEATKSYSGNVEIIEMDRMRKLISKNMIASKQTSAHVTSFVEADVTNLVLWRNKIKDKLKDVWRELHVYAYFYRSGGKSITRFSDDKLLCRWRQSYRQKRPERGYGSGFAEW